MPTFPTVYMFESELVSLFRKKKLKIKKIIVSSTSPHLES